MRSSSMASGLVAVAVCASVAPLGSMEKRELGGVLICQGANATGSCHYETYSMGVCHDLPANLSANAATFAPDGDHFYCYPRVGPCAVVCRSPTGCTFGSVNFASPVKYNLASIKWDKLIQSFTCYENSSAIAT